jgi:GNAT superfamily N-acetyltransferase
MISRTSLNKTRISQWLDIMRQLRPSVAAEAVDELIPWRYKFITASRDNRIVGVGTYYPTASLIRGKFHYIADLVVDSKYQGKGVGTEMMREIVDPTISYELDSGLERIDAHHFYLSHGFLHTGYAVRPPVAVLMSIENLPQQLTYHIDGSQHLEAQGKNKLDQIQAFIDEHAGMNSAYQANLQLFMINNSDRFYCQRWIRCSSKTRSVIAVSFTASKKNEFTRSLYQNYRCRNAGRRCTKA